MMPGAMKRKRDDIDDVSVTSTEQRKSILDISMLKLRSSPLQLSPQLQQQQRRPRRVEPSLRRSVLIFNTLKTIEAQLKLEGVTVPPNPTPELLPVIQDDSDVNDAVPCCYCSHGNCSHGGGCHGNVCHVNTGAGAPHCSAMDAPSNSVYRFNEAYPPNVHHHNTGRLPCTPYQPASHASHSPPAASHHHHHHHSPPCPQSDLVSASHLGPSPDHAHHPTSSTQSPPPTYSPPPSTSQSNDSYHYHANTSSQSSDAFHHHGNTSSCSMSMSVTESLFSDTSKMLDTLLSSDKLVAVASFTSLFELDGTAPGGGAVTSSNPMGVTSSNSVTTVSQVSQDWGSQECGHVTTSPGEEWGRRAAATTTISAATGESQQWCTSPTYQQLSTPSSAPGYTSATSVATSATSATSPTAAATQAQAPLTCRQEYDSATVTATGASLADIDCNMFDFDLFMPTLSPSSKLTPLNHDDLAHSLPSAEVPFPTGPWPPKAEHITDDLDHIMQILVGL